MQVTDLDEKNASTSEELDTSLLRKKNDSSLRFRLSEVDTELASICKAGSLFNCHYERVKEVGYG